MDRARNSASSRRMHMVLPNHPHPATWEWPSPSITLREIFNTTKPSHKFLSKRNFYPAFATIVGNWGIMPTNARTLGRTSPSSRNRTPEWIRAIAIRIPRFKWSKANLSSWVIFYAKANHLIFVFYLRISRRDYFQGGRLWCPRFSLGIINPNDLVKHIDFGQTLVSLGHTSKN
jgi:hypothetical protein